MTDSEAKVAQPVSAENETAPAPVAVFKRRGGRGKANIRKRPATPPPVNDDSDFDYSSSEDEAGQRIKRRKKNTGTVTASSKNHAARTQDLSATTFSADRSVPISSVNDATKASNWYDEEANDALSAKNLLGSTRSGTNQVDAPDGTYKGLANQTSFVKKNPDAPNRSFGPVKAPTNIRTITVTDYAADTCKDYVSRGLASPYLT